LAGAKNALPCGGIRSQSDFWRVGTCGERPRAEDPRSEACVTKARFGYASLEPCRGVSVTERKPRVARCGSLITRVETYFEPAGSKICARTRAQPRLRKLLLANLWPPPKYSATRGRSVKSFFGTGSLKYRDFHKAYSKKNAINPPRSPRAENFGKIARGARVL
jgi:hypothetical protein